MNKSDIAQLLLSINAVQLKPHEPFQFSSGLSSPVYCDNRLIISYPNERQHITDGFLELIKQNRLQFDIVAGTATAGIPHASWLADKLNKPLIYIRSKAKSHGTGNQIEGRVEAGQSVLLVEDLISTGGSVINAANAIREAQARVEHVLCIFTYGLDIAKEKLHSAQLQCRALTDFESMTQAAADANIIKNEDLPSLQQWQKDPVKWAGHLKRQK